ncbi:MAG: hypothetical protein IJW71_03015 [Clostridia bacterium]|nr:hypothetical protein [Clostridia bacterium]
MQGWFPELYGNDAQKKRIGAAIRDRKLPHALILEGADGSGKMFFARQIAAALSCKSEEGRPCGQCPSCQKILSGNSPDVTVIDRGERATIGVDAVREARSDMYLSATEEEHKVYIFNDAHTMNDAAQNALLIVLEEPPAQVHVLLLTENADCLLQTVRSRAMTFRMNLFTPQEIADYLRKNDPRAERLYSTDQQKFDAAIYGAGGCIGSAIASLDPVRAEELAERRRIVHQIISTIASRMDYPSVFQAFSALPQQKRQELCDLLFELIEAIRDLIAIKRAPDVPLLYFANRSVAEELADSLGIVRLFRLYERIDGAICALSHNANINAVMTLLITDVQNL